MPRRRSVQSSSRTPRYEVTEFDCPTRFLVRSESRPDEVHLVDLDAEDERVCECSCEDWEFRNKDWLSSEGKVVRFKAYECKHIKQVWAWKRYRDVLRDSPPI